MTTAPLFQPSAGVLIASSDPGFRDRIAAHFADQCTAELATGGADALAKLETSECDLLILDRHLPDLNVDELRDLAARDYPGVQVAILDSSSPDPLSSLKKNCAGTGRVLPWANTAGEKKFTDPQSRERFEPLPGMVGSTLPMQKLAKLVRLVAPRNTAVLITGPTGSGKELVARAVHDLSPRAERPFVVINCAAIPEALLEAELFGYTRGAFTGAVQSRIGRIHAAQGGTLFLDEIGELPMGLQAKLLRFLEYREVQRLITIPGADVGAAASQTVQTGSLAFDNTGNLTTPAADIAGLTVTGLADGAANLTFDWQLYQNGAGTITQVASPSSPSSTEQDGFGAGSLESFSIGGDGIIEGTFSNGKTAMLGQLALANFPNSQGLMRAGGNNYTATLASGAATVGAPGAGGRGSLTGGALELSNVDIATEFANLIQAQRAFQANARTITTFDEITQDTINLKR